MPKTKLGKWSVGLIIFFFLLFVIFQLLIASGQQGGDTFFDNLTFSVPALLAGISAILAFILGLISIIKSREKSLLVILATLIGLFVLIFVLGEFLFPH